MDIAQLLPKDIYDALTNATTPPTAANPFVTAADAGGAGDLSSVLTAGDTGSAGQNINLVGGAFTTNNNGTTAGPTCTNAGVSISSAIGATTIETTTCRPSLVHDLELTASTIGSYVKIQSVSTGDGLFKVIGNGEATVQFNLSGTNRTIQFQDGDGIVAFTTDIEVTAVAQTYTPSNVTTDRTYDANATSLDEVADVLGTLIGDLQTSGIIL